MHPYAINSNERTNIPFYIAVLAILAAIGLNYFFEHFQIKVPWWIDYPSVMGFYALFLALFNKVIWKWEFLNKIGFISTPNLQGEWKGHVLTSFDAQAQQHEAGVKITQEWTNIYIVFQGKYSKSTSKVAGFILNNEIILIYEYFNEPLPGAVETMHAHKGTAVLVLSTDGKKLDGEYYSGRDRQNFGSMHLEKLESNSDLEARSQEDLNSH